MINAGVDRINRVLEMVNENGTEEEVEAVQAFVTMLYTPDDDFNRLYDSGMDDEKPLDDETLIKYFDKSVSAALDDGIRLDKTKLTL